MTARRATALLALAGALWAPALAHADGDPASDVLLQRDVYVPYFPAPKKPLVAELQRKLAEARRAGYPIKVAMIQTQGDLGAYPELFGQTDKYARLLEREIVFKVKRPHLVIVMPQGLAGRNLGPKGDAVLRAIKVDAAKKSDGLVAAATQAVDQLAAASGHPLKNTSTKTSSGGGGSDHTLLYVLAGVIVLLGLALIAVSIRARRTSQDVAGEGGDDGDGAGPEQDRDERG